MHFRLLRLGLGQTFLLLLCDLGVYFCLLRFPLRSTSELDLWAYLELCNSDL